MAALLFCSSHRLLEPTQLLSRRNVCNNCYQGAPRRTIPPCTLKSITSSCPSLYAHKNLKSLESTVDAEIFRVYNWLIANKLSLDIKKSNFVIFRPRQKKLNHQVNLKVSDHHNNSFISLECKNYVKYLGVLIDENLSWKYHIAHIASKISKTIGIIASLRHFVPLNTLHHIHVSLIQPYLLYGIVAWGE